MTTKLNAQQINELIDAHWLCSMPTCKDRPPHCFICPHELFNEFTWPCELLSGLTELKELRESESELTQVQA